jgi:hypothetical protein
MTTTDVDAFSFIAMRSNSGLALQFGRPDIQSVLYQTLFPQAKFSVIAFQKTRSHRVAVQLFSLVAHEFRRNQCQR